MEKKSFKEKCAESWDNVRDTVSYGIHSPGAFAADALDGMALIADDVLFDNKPAMKRLVDDRRKRCAKVALTGLLALGLVVTGIKGCNSEGKKADLPVRSQQMER